MSRDDLLTAIRVLIDLDHHDRARAAAELVPEHLDLPDLLRAGDGVQQLARAVDVRRRVAATAREEGRAAPLESRYE